jgi:hypothetical protein
LAFVVKHRKIKTKKHKHLNQYFMQKLFSNILSFVFLVIIFTSCNDDGWEYLFNGKNLDGWKQLNGKAKYEVVNGEIVGTTVANTPNSFLVTEKVYSDFIIEVELLLTEDMNSGIQFRSESNPEYNNGRVYGYQCEVDPSERRWSAGIYDEARRGWLYPVELNPSAKKAFKMGEWNKYRIECFGNSLRTWLNGIPVAHVIDDMTSEGFIALQIHGIGSNKEKLGHQIKWKNIRIKTKDLVPFPIEKIHVVNFLPNDISDAEALLGYKLLFDGETTNGWKSAKSDSFPDQGWEIKDGILSVMENAGGGDIVTNEKFSAFELKFDFNMTEGANSGIIYCIGNNGPSIGLEYQLLDDEYHVDAINGIDGNRTLASLYDLITSKKINRLVKKPGEWNRGRIILSPENKVEHWLNGRKVVEYTRGDSTFNALVAKSQYAKFEDFAMAEESPILLQDHKTTIHFRSIKIKPLK